MAQWLWKKTHKIQRTTTINVVCELYQVLLWWNDQMLGSVKMWIWKNFDVVFLFVLKSEAKCSINRLAVFSRLCLASPETRRRWQTSTSTCIPPSPPSQCWRLSLQRSTCSYTPTVNPPLPHKDRPPLLAFDFYFILFLSVCARQQCWVSSPALSRVSGFSAGKSTMPKPRPSAWAAGAL